MTYPLTYRQTFNRCFFLLTFLGLLIAFSHMGNIYIERNSAGNYEVKERGNPKPLAVAPTQKQAEQKAAELRPGVAPDVERVKHTDRGHPDQWRKAP
jgi:hypothetical protein